MTSHELLQADLLDILFDNRNKSYGAYSLRKQYPSTLFRALLLALALISLLVFLAGTGHQPPRVGPGEKSWVRILTIPPLVPVPPKQPQIAPPPRPRVQRAYLDNIQLVHQPDPEKEIQPLQQLDHAALSSRNVEGAPAAPEGASSGVPPSAQTVPALPREEKEKKFEPLERQPEFPGGARAWADFLNRYLRTPGELEPGEKKTVLINFQVDADGTVTGFSVLQSGGEAFDNEVIRVLRKMPKWKPAFQNGHAITVSFSQPVTFVGVEE